MTEKYIKVTNNDFERVFIGDIEIGFGFVGDEQFFGQLIDEDYIPVFSEESVFSIFETISIMESQDYVCKYEWYYNDIKSLENATKIDSNENTIVLPKECSDKYVCCKITYSKQYYYGNKVVEIFSDTTVQDNRQERRIQVLFDKSQNVVVGNSYIGTLVVLPSSNLELSDFIIIGDNIPQGFITIYQEDEDYKILFDGSKADIGKYTFNIATKDNQSYKYGISREYSFEVLEKSIQNPTITLSGNGRFGESLVCIPSTDTEDVAYKYEWIINGNQIDNTTNTLEITDKRWIGQKAQCNVTFTREGYESKLLTSNAITITKGIRKLEFVDYNSDDIIYINENDKILIPYTATEGNGTYSLTTQDNQYYRITNDTISKSIMIEGKNVQMTSFNTIYIYVYEDDCYTQSNVISIKIQTLQNIWGNITVRLSDNTQVGENLSILVDNKSELSYKLENVRWYTMDSIEDDYANWKLIQNESEESIFLSDIYKGKYIGCVFDIKNQQTEETIQFTQISNIVYMTLYVSNKSIEGNTYYAQKLNTIFDIYDQNGEIIISNN